MVCIVTLTLFLTEKDSKWGDVRFRSVDSSLTQTPHLSHRPTAKMPTVPSLQIAVGVTKIKDLLSVLCLNTKRK